MCEFCEGDHRLRQSVESEDDMGGYEARLEEDRDGWSLHVSATDSCYPLDAYGCDLTEVTVGVDVAGIRFCPFCGREL